MHVIAIAIIILDHVITKSQGCSQRSASGANLAILEAHLQRVVSAVRLMPIAVDMERVV